MVSRTFPAYHSKKGQQTYFIEQIKNAIYDGLYLLKPDGTIITGKKLHTFRGNFPLWKKRIDEVLAGNAVIVLKYHTLGRYVKGNKQIEFARLDKDSGVGVQPVVLYSDDTANIWDSDFVSRGYWPHVEFFEKIAENDGLSLSDFKDWFYKGNYDMNEDFACIHFTPFRYGRTLPSPK
jgi:hypothetical protein